MINAYLVEDAKFAVNLLLRRATKTILQHHRDVSCNSLDYATQDAKDVPDAGG